MTTKNSTLVSNFEASPQVANSVHQSGGRMRVLQGSVALAATDIDNDDVIMLAPIPVGASVTSIQIAADDLDSGGSPSLAFNVGLYQTDGTVKDEDCYASAVTLGQAATAFTEVAFEARGIEKCGQQVFEDAGDTSRPDDQLFLIGATVSAAAATAAAGDMSFIITYVHD